MSRSAAFVASIVLACSGLTLAGINPAGGAAPLPPGYSVKETTGVHRGVSYRQLAKPDRPVLAHVAHVDPGAAVDLRVVNGSDKIPNRYADLETTGSMCRRVECLVAVNGDFHYQEQPVGGVVAGGRMLRSPIADRPQLLIEENGRLSAGGLPWTGWLILSNGVRLPLDGINVPPRDGVVLYTGEWGAQTAAPGRVEVVVGTPAPAGVLNQATPVQFQSRRAAPGPIPAGAAVLSASGSGAEALEAAWRNYQQKAISGQAHLVVESPVRVVESVGVNPVVLRDGRHALPWPADPNVITAVQPRTLIGWNDAGDRFFVAVDGRQPSSVGLTMAEAADFLLGLGATDAVNLDGGGGTTFVVNGALRNRPSDHADQNPPPERVAPNALVVLPRQATPAQPTSTTQPGTVRPMLVGEPAEQSPGPVATGDAPIPTDGLTEPSLPVDANGDGVADSPPGDGAPGADGQTDPTFRVGALIDKARKGGPVPGPDRPWTVGDGVPEGTGGSPEAGTTGAGSETDQLARALPEQAAKALAGPRSGPWGSLLDHVATRLALALALMGLGVRTVASRRHLRPPSPRPVQPAVRPSSPEPSQPESRPERALGSMFAEVRGPVNLHLVIPVRQIVHASPTTDSDSENPSENRRGYTDRRSAPLAQTAEHFHGKEGVYGSIP